MTDNNQASEDMVDEILEDLVYDTPNSYGYPPDFDPDFAKAKQAITDWRDKRELEAMIDSLEYAKISPKFKIEEKIEQLRLEAER